MSNFLYPGLWQSVQLERVEDAIFNDTINLASSLSEAQKNALRDSLDDRMNKLEELLIGNPYDSIAQMLLPERRCSHISVTFEDEASGRFSMSSYTLDGNGNVVEKDLASIETQDTDDIEVNAYTSVQSYYCPLKK